jgi:hypothetical protein
MTPRIAVGMGGSIPGCTLEKNRWFGKALFTASHEWAVGRSKNLPPSFSR